MKYSLLNYRTKSKKNHEKKTLNWRFALLKLLKPDNLDIFLGKSFSEDIMLLIRSLNWSVGSYYRLIILRKLLFSNNLSKKYRLFYTAKLLCRISVQILWCNGDQKDFWKLSTCNKINKCWLNFIWWYWASVHSSIKKLIMCIVPPFMTD